MNSIETSINWFYARAGKIQYSMADRYGPESYDCSSAVYNALIAGGYLPKGTMGNADSLFGHLEDNGWNKTSSPVRGDVFIWGRRGACSGKYGNAGIFTDSSTIIHCNITANGISINQYSSALSAAGMPPAEIYHRPDLSDGIPDQDEDSEMNNTGELELLGIADGKIVAEGWHYSQGKETDYIVFLNAETDEEIGRVKSERIIREDLKEKYPDIPGIENFGFSARLAVPNNTAVYIKSIRTDGVSPDELIFNKIIIFEQEFDPDAESYAETNEKFFFEIISSGKIVKRGNKILNDLAWTNELMYIPSTEIVLPIEFKEYIKAREEIKLYINHKVFHGIVIDVEEDKQDETLTLSLAHVITEWKYRQISTNLAVKERTVNDIYSTLDFRYPNWNVEYLQDSAGRIIDYVYSRQSKLDGLTKTCELTDDLFWRVGFRVGRALEIGTFGEKKQFVFSTRPSSARNVRIISEPIIHHDFENVINIATVYGEKSDSGMSSMSLRDVYEERGAQDPNFPVVILKNGINNERGYDYIEFTKLAPNNELEYTVIDSESIALEGGTVIEGTFSFNDLAPFNTDGEEITDEDRAKASKTAYDAAIRKLKQSRRRTSIIIETEELPTGLNVGDMVMFKYQNLLNIMGNCSNYQKKILSIDDWFYITAIEYVFDKTGGEYNIVSLEKELRIERESDMQ